MKNKDIKTGKLSISRGCYMDGPIEALLKCSQFFTYGSDIKAYTERCVVYCEGENCNGNELDKHCAYNCNMWTLSSAKGVGQI